VKNVRSVYFMVKQYKHVNNRVILL